MPSPHYQTASAYFAALAASVPATACLICPRISFPFCLPLKFDRHHPQVRVPTLQRFPHSPPEWPRLRKPQP